MFGKKTRIIVEVVKKECDGKVFRLVFKDKLEWITLVVDSKSYNKINVGDYGALTMKDDTFINFKNLFSKQ